jgi:hypothetical protein
METNKNQPGLETRGTAYNARPEASEGKPCTNPIHVNCVTDGRNHVELPTPSALPTDTNKGNPMIQYIPPSPEYLDGFYAAMTEARACIKREMEAWNLSKEKPSDPDTTQRHLLLSVDTAIQEVKPR